MRTPSCPFYWGPATKRIFPAISRSTWDLIMGTIPETWSYQKYVEYLLREGLYTVIKNGLPNPQSSN